MTTPECTQDRPASEVIFDKLDVDKRLLAERFESNIQSVKGFMFGLADQLVDDYPKKKWNLIIGDDTSGRLPTRFIRKAFESQGIDLPVSYVMASRKSRRDVPQELYEAYAQSLADKLDEPMRALIVTENSSGTANCTIRFVEDLIKPVAQSVDMATVAARVKDESFNNLYVGGVGEDATSSIASTFESFALDDQVSFPRKLVQRFIPKSVKDTIHNFTGGATRVDLVSSSSTNLDNACYGQPVARRAEDVTYRPLAAYCYTRMDKLAQEYAKHREVSELMELAAIRFN